MDSAGNGQRPLTRLGADDSGPAWSPKMEVTGLPSQPGATHSRS